MILHEPFKISARLLPALQIGDAWLSWNNFEFFLDRPGEPEYVIDDFRPGLGAQPQECFAAILSFMDAAAESRKYRERAGRHLGVAFDSNEDLFPPHIVDWIVDNLDEIGDLRWEIEESEKELIEL